MSVASPCTGICELDDAEVCAGCGRTLMEIAGWSSMSGDEKLAVWRRLVAEGLAEACAEG